DQGREPVAQQRRRGASIGCDPYVQHGLVRSCWRREIRERHTREQNAVANSSLLDRHLNVVAYGISATSSTAHDRGQTLGDGDRRLGKPVDRREEFPQPRSICEQSFFVGPIQGEGSVEIRDGQLLSGEEAATSKMFA